MNFYVFQVDGSTSSLAATENHKLIELWYLKIVNLGTTLWTNAELSEILGTDNVMWIVNNKYKCQLEMDICISWILIQWLHVFWMLIYSGKHEILKIFEIFSQLIILHRVISTHWHKKHWIWYTYKWRSICTTVEIILRTFECIKHEVLIKNYAIIFVII